MGNSRRWWFTPFQIFKMIKFGIYFVYAFVACNLYGITYSQNHTNSVCILEDAPSQCGAFCLSAQRPFIDYNYKVQRQMNSISEMLDKIEKATLARQIESPSNFERIQQEALTAQKENLAKMDRIENLKLESQTSAERIQRENQAKMDRIEKGTLETQASLERIQRENQATMNRISQEIKSISMGFQWIESRYFYIENNFKQTWINAEDTCRRMGGHLAAFQSRRELDAVSSKLHRDTPYWMGISDRENEGYFVTSSGNRFPYLTFNDGEPNNSGGNEDCVDIYNGIMNDIQCESLRSYICQLGN